MHRLARRIWLFALVALLSCSSKKDDAQRAPLPIAKGCNPLAADWDCLLPFPSDVFLVPDATMPSKRRLALGEAVLRTKQGTRVDFTKLHPADGASHLPPILAVFPGGVDDADLTFHDRTEVSITGASTTMLIDAETGTKVLHFAELDPFADDARRALIIRPLVKLENNRRYLVAIRRLHDKGRKLIVAPEGFRRIRDKDTVGDPILAPLGERYEKEIFPALEKAGVARVELQLAWDFTTRSEENATRDMLAVRRAVMDTFSKTPPKVTITEVKEKPDARTFRLVHGTIRVPLFVENAKPMAKLNRDASGNVVAKGETEVPFSVFIPPSVADGTEPARAFQYGHGFFGEKEEVEASWSAVPVLAEKTRMVGMAVQWWGMGNDDEDPVADTIVADKMEEVFTFTDRVHQGMANQLALAYAAVGPLATEPSMQIDGRAAYDTKRLEYFGISQGHILGGTYVALSPHISRAVLNVGGAGFSLMMSRSHSFQPFIAFIQILVPDRLDLQKFLSLSQLSMDRIESVSYAPHLIAKTYEGSPPSRRVLLQMGMYDSLVANLASEIHARSIGVKHLVPSPKKIVGLEEAPQGYDGSALIVFDMKVKDDQRDGVSAIIPEKNNPVHEGVRRLSVMPKQMDAFLKSPGKAQSFCDGACDPE